MKIEKFYSFSLIAFLLASFTLLLISLYSGQSHKLIVSDGKAYYAWTRSVFVDGDIDFKNDYAALYPPDPLPQEIEQYTPKGYVVNKYPIGLGILEIPGFLIGHIITNLLSSASPDGISPPYQISVTFSLVSLYIWSFFLLFKAMLCFGSNRFWACWLCLMMLAGTNMIHYIAKEPAMAHMAGCAVFNIIMYYVSRWPATWKDIPVGQKLFIGGLIGLLFLIRNSNIFLFPALFFLVWQPRSLKIKPLLPIIFSTSIIMSLQLGVLYILWGHVHLFSYPNESFNTDLSGIVKTLFSHRHGLFIYRPWYLFLLLINVIAIFVEKTRINLPLFSVISFLILLVMNGTWWCWWFGDSFGNRAFIETLPLLSIGAGMVLSRMQRVQKQPVYFACGSICLINLYLWCGYLLQKYPHDGTHTITQVYLWLKTF